MKGKMILGAICIMLLLSLSGCGVAEPINCRLPCQLGIDQASILTVEDFEKTLVKNGWIQNDPNREFIASYAPDTFSAVLETTTSIELDGTSPNYYGSEVILYIGYVGGISPNHDAVTQETIESIRISSNLSILESWLLYGLPEGGRVLPFYAEGEREISCGPNSYYFAYYDDGKTIIRAEIPHPILLNMWTANVEMVYPIEKSLEYSSYWIGRYQQLDHRFCVP